MLELNANGLNSVFLPQHLSLEKLMIHSFRRFGALLSLLLLSFFSWSQDDLLLVSGTLSDDANRKKLTGVEVVVYQDGVEFDRMSTDARASYSFQLPLRHDYLFSYEFEGYGNKRIQVDASGVPLEDLKGGFNLDLDMTLFTLVEGFDESILEDPYGKASFDSQRNTVAFDFDYTARMKTRVENEFDRVERMAESLAQMKKDFADLMSRGDAFLARQKWEDALKSFTDALALFPDDSQALAKQAEAQAAVDAAKNAEQLEADFQAALDEGNSFLKADRLDRSREAFESAQALKPTAPEPADGLARVAAREAELGEDAAYASKVAAADKAFKEQRYDSAKSLYEEASSMKSSERYPRDQITACNSALNAMAADAAALAARAAEYESLIELADRNFRSKNWRDALRQYEEAAVLIPTETHPVDRAEKCRENLLADENEAEASARAAANAAASAELDASYDDAVARGDAAYSAQSWSAAQSAYEEALGFKPTERYPVARLERINKELTRAEAAADAENEARAAAKADEDRRLAEERAKSEAAAAEAAAQAERESRAADLAASAAQAEAQRRAAQEEASRRAREVAAALQVDEDDEAEAYYREALESERRAKALAVEREKEDAAALLDRASSRAAENRMEAQVEIESMNAVSEEIRTSGMRRHAQQVEDSEAMKAAVDKEQRRMAVRGDNMRRDGLLDVRDSYEQTDEMLSEHRYDYRDEMPAIEQEHSSQRSRESDWSRTSAEYRAIAQENVQLSAQDYAALGADEMDRLRATQADIYAATNSQQQAQVNRENQAEDRRYNAYQEVLSLDQGSAPKHEDYILSPEDAEVAPGIQEQSYDIPNGLVIERTVRIGNHVRRFRKVVTKTGVYYFEGDESITESTWRRETMVVLD